MMNNLSIQYILLEASADLPKAELEYLLMHTLQQTKAYLYTHPEYVLNPTEIKAFQENKRQLLSGIPLAYITQVKHFWKQTLTVNCDTLIPRSETESMVEWVLELLPENKNDIHIADLGTGSGAIAIALASERSQWQLIATDAHATTLAIAQYNAKKHQCHNIIFLHGHWCDALPPKKALLFSAIISNPPYIADADPHLAALRHEPQHALTSGPQGLNDLMQIIETAYNHLAPNGFLMLEHGYDQRPALIAAMEQRGYCGIAYRNDLNGIPRMIVGYR